MRREDYFRKLDDWARVYSESKEVKYWDSYERGQPDGLGKNRFITAWNRVRSWLSIIELPEYASAETYCNFIIEAKAKETDKYFLECWQGIYLRVCKSNCLGRLFYGDEELRTEPCPEHKGHWCWPAGSSGWDFRTNSKIEGCCDGTGWLPNPKPHVPDYQI